MNHYSYTVEKVSNETRNIQLLGVYSNLKAAQAHERDIHNYYKKQGYVQAWSLGGHDEGAFYQMSHVYMTRGQEYYQMTIRRWKMR
jgi:hypothetical protein